LFYITIVTHFEREITPGWLRDSHRTKSNGFLEKGFRNSRNYVLKFLFYFRIRETFKAK